MKFEQLLTLVGDEPVFETALLLAGPVRPQAVQRQLARWVASGVVHQLRRGLYALAAPYCKRQAHPFLLANRIAPGSYVSLQSALSFYELIPENVPMCTSVGTGRPGSHSTHLGRFELRHLRKTLVFGYQALDLGPPELALVALPEKALLDLVYLTPDGDKESYLAELRLQNMETLDLQRLKELAVRFNKPKLIRAAHRVAELAERELYVDLPA